MSVWTWARSLATIVVTISASGAVAARASLAEVSSSSLPAVPGAFSSKMTWALPSSFSLMQLPSSSPMAVPYSAYWMFSKVVPGWGPLSP